MPDLTRAGALALARAEYGLFARSLLGQVDGAQRDYVQALVAHWDYRLSSLSLLGPAIPVSSGVMSALDFLTQAVHAESLDPDARLHWLDAFPEAVADLFPPSAVTFALQAAPALPSSPRSTRGVLARAA